MPIIKTQPEKKYPFFVKCFMKNKKKTEGNKRKSEMGKDEKVEEGQICPQCPKPVCLVGDSVEETGK